MMNRRLKLGLSITFVAVAFIRLAFYDSLSTRMDTVFLGLLAFAFLVNVIAWERLSSLRAGGLEVSIEQTNIQAALKGLGLARIDNEQFKRKLSNLGESLDSIQGSRVLWIDDKPHNIVAERRLLRTLGIEVKSVTSSRDAEEILETDNDFDLLISDVQRAGESYKVVGGEKVHEGVNFVVRLRSHEDPVIKALPVIFYAAYPWDRLIKFTRPARELLPEPEISNSSSDFILKVVKKLAEVRSTPIVYSEVKKAPTSIRRT